MNSIILKHNDEIQLGDSIRFIFINTPAEAGIPPQEPTYHPEAELTIVDASPIQPDIKEEYFSEPPSHALVQAAEDEFILPDQDDHTIRNRLRLVGCGCLFILLPLLCVGLVLFLDFYEQGRLLYCGPVRPIFEILLGPLGFSPICP